MRKKIWLVFGLAQKDLDVTSADWTALVEKAERVKDRHEDLPGNSICVLRIRLFSPEMGDVFGTYHKSVGVEAELAMCSQFLAKTPMAGEKARALRWGFPHLNS
jgi:hypothetical protein